MILLPFFASSTGYGSTKNLLSLPFQAPVFFVLSNIYAHYLRLCEKVALICSLSLLEHFESKIGPEMRPKMAKNNL